MTAGGYEADRMRSWTARRLPGPGPGMPATRDDVTVTRHAVVTRAGARPGGLLAVAIHGWSRLPGKDSGSRCCGDAASHELPVVVDYGSGAR